MVLGLYIFIRPYQNNDMFHVGLVSRIVCHLVSDLAGQKINKNVNHLTEFI